MVKEMEYWLPGVDTADRKEAQWDSCNRNMLHHDWRVWFMQAYAFVKVHKTVHLSSVCKFYLNLKIKPLEGYNKNELDLDLLRHT